MIGFGDGPSLGRDKGFLMSLQSFPRGGTFLSRQKFQEWRCDKMFFYRDPQGRPTHATGRWTRTIGLGYPRDR